MTKKKLFDDIRHNPSRIYRTPGDVLRDRRFADAERLEILRAWRDAAPQTPEAGEIGAIIVELEGRLYPVNDHAAE
jgi:hypothetical protein